MSATPCPERILLDNARLPGATDLTSLILADGMVHSLGEAGGTQALPSQRLDLDGRTVLPGFWDAHVHVESWAISRRRLDLHGTKSAREAADLAAEAAAAMSDPDEILIGYGYRDGLWPDLPHKDLYRGVAADRVIALQSNDLHTAWLSPTALRRIGAPDHPTGVLREIDCYRAMAALQEYSVDQVDAWIAEALDDAAAHGVTGLMDFEFGDCLPSWQRRVRRQRLPVRVSCTVYKEHLDVAIERGMKTGDIAPDTDGMVEAGPLKLFVDGSLNSRSALCHDAYPGASASSDAHGLLETPPDELRRLMGKASEHGIHSAVHAIGDLAAEMAIDAFEELACDGRIEHAQLLPPHGVARLAKLGLTVGVQPAHLLGDRDVADRHWAGRTHRAFAYADMVTAGIQVELGSDAPVTPLDPWLGIRAAVLRAQGADDEPWHPEQRMGIADTLTAACRGRSGLHPGTRADLVVLEHDPIRADLTQLADPGVVGTMVAGNWTYRTF
ncbi:amidohydrolase family protein [Phytoactinopolyspora alkaliphila]|uniref:Amidohydrolase family protein n=1 Tax=Phytoactinopolyspora alkaliphila TaxID=1783498 RepID=A0A6N9YNJ8_9ACTN|nr:amidohydrolase family protein [Phytoactinopolyspora alkaliphila]NED96515.1 amidohydrolase family protein [Phytoactinopolyspora alkaliphila]